MEMSTITVVVISQKCRECDFRPGEGRVTDVVLRAALEDYRVIANDHAVSNHGHRVDTLIDGRPHAVTVHHGIVPEGSVPCDQCHSLFPKSESVGWEDLVLCKRCAGLDPCRCGHLKDEHTPGGDECERCGCSRYIGGV